MPTAKQSVDDGQDTDVMSVMSGGELDCTTQGTGVVAPDGVTSSTTPTRPMKSTNTAAPVIRILIGRNAGHHQPDSAIAFLPECWDVTADPAHFPHRTLQPIAQGRRQPPGAN